MHVLASRSKKTRPLQWNWHVKKWNARNAQATCFEQAFHEQRGADQMCDDRASRQQQLCKRSASRVTCETPKSSGREFSSPLFLPRMAVPNAAQNPRPCEQIRAHTSLPNLHSNAIIGRNWSEELAIRKSKTFVHVSSISKEKIEDSLI